MKSSGLEWLWDSARKHPEGLLLLAAGAALLLRERKWEGDVWNASEDYQFDARHRSLKPAQPGASEYASGLRDTVAETVGEYASSVSGYVGETGQRIVDRSSAYAARAHTSVQHTIDRIVQEQPLAIAVAGLAAGAAVAAAFPMTTVENETLSPIKDRLSAATEEGTRRVGNAVDAARDTLSEALDEKGLNAEGLKEAARDVTKAAKSSLSGSSNGRRPSGDGRSPGSGGPPAKPGSTSSATGEGDLL